jgi:hypothetical protein
VDSTESVDQKFPPECKNKAERFFAPIPEGRKNRATLFLHSGLMVYQLKTGRF